MPRSTDDERPAEVMGAFATRPDRVLVVDDDAAVRAVVTSLLRRRGFEVSEACDGVEALVAIQTMAPDLVVSDLTMPGCDGERLCVTLKQDARTAAIPFILVTGADIDEDAMRRAGCAAVLHKPLPASFTELVTTVLRSSQREHPPIHCSPQHLSRRVSDV